ncbi:hypothetical protein TrLO_g5880 [Triparma laevis f. longispina]|uniref:Uncharacterized protein n=1 Tax=Triparma laevis f. longispina TaxID=1714387 RepID=A0A9W7AHW0_9STRA|nr:hypothetical protein TrLO_g5880 [Triparma laevis f. longispina]
MRSVILLCLLVRVNPFLVPLNLIAGTRSPSTSHVTTSKCSNLADSRSTALKALFGWSDEENKILDEMVAQKGISREQAEAEYKKYKMNPNDYALMKGEEYYTSLGYSSLMEGVIAEAEKEGRGDEVKKRIEDFKKESQLKAYGVITVFIGVFCACKIAYENDPSIFGK